MKNAIIKTVNLNKDYKNDKDSVRIINNVNLEIYKGDFTVIMGSSGSGKSTLLYLLSCLEKPTSGEVIFDNEKMSCGNYKNMAKMRQNKMGFVFQDINLIPNLSVLDNICVAGFLGKKKRQEVINDAEKLLEKLGVNEHAKKLPAKLSGGQQQRVAIVRALINSPEVFFADEPTGALNSTSGEEVLDYLVKINREGQSIVMVTHDIKAAVRADRILFLKDGDIVSELSLSKYKKEDKEDREKEVSSYLSKMGW